MTTLRVENEERATQGAITFETQEHFDAAVRKYLAIDITLYEDYGDVKLSVMLTDTLTGVTVDSAKDYCTVVESKWE